MRKREIALTSLLILVLFTTACTSGVIQTTTASTTGAITTQAPTTVKDDRVRGGTIKIAVSADATTLKSYRLRGPTDRAYGCVIFETLLSLNAQGSPEPFLAESITEDVEGLAYIIKLKEGIMFQDGSELDAEVCKWNLDLYNEKGVQNKAFFKSVKSFEVVDKYTVKINLNEWDALIPLYLARQGGAGYMISKLAWDTYGEDYCAENPVSTAPFKVVAWNRDVGMKLEKFEGYWQGEPYLDGVEFEIYSTPLVAQAAFLTGDVHAQMISDNTVAKYLEGQGFTVTKSNIPGQCYTVCFQCLDPDDPFYNKTLRQAAMYAINPQEFVDTVFAGYSEITNQYAKKGTTYYNDKVEGYPYNPEKAKQLLIEAGYPNGFKTVITVGTAALAQNIAQILKEQLAKVGITLDLNITDTAGESTTVDNWGKGIYVHAMGADPGAAAILAGSYASGLSSGIGHSAFSRPDGLSYLIEQGKSSGLEESIDYFKQAMKLVYDDGGFIKALAMIYQSSVTSPKLHDANFGETVGTSSDLWDAWLEK